MQLWQPWPAVALLAEQGNCSTCTKNINHFKILGKLQVRKIDEDCGSFQNGSTFFWKEFCIQQQQFKAKAWPISSRQWWHEKSVVVFRSQITKQPETVSSWTHYVAASEWFMHLSFLICWNKASTFLFHCTSQVFRDKEVRMEHTSLKKSAKSIRQFVQACLLPQAFCGEVTITLWLICECWPSTGLSQGLC